MNRVEYGLVDRHSLRHFEIFWKIFLEKNLRSITRIYIENIIDFLISLIFSRPCLLIESYIFLKIIFKMCLFLKSFTQKNQEIERGSFTLRPQMHFTSKLLGALYIAEVSRPSLRGAFGNCLSLSVAVGITFTMVSGALMDWRTLALSCGILPLMGNRSISDIKKL